MLGRKEIKGKYSFIVFSLIQGGSMKFQNREAINFIFCNHPLSNKTVDPDYEKEYALALHLGGKLLSQHELSSK